MYSNTITKNEEITLLKKRNVDCKGLSVTYKLYLLKTVEAREYYALEVATENGGELAALGDEYRYASDLFERIADGGVTPTGLIDVVQDANMSKKY